MLALWEEDQVRISALVKRLGLNTNTLTPLLKRMADAGLIQRTRSKVDERSVIISLTDRGASMYEQAQHIPEEIQNSLSEDKLSEQEYLALRDQLDRLIFLLDK